MPNDGKDAAARLLQSLQPPGDISCDDAQQQLPSFVEAERAGIDVDAMPEYAALRRHLDRCETCIDLYESMVEDLDALAGESERLPPAPVAPPAFSNVARQSEWVRLRVFQGRARGFDLTLAGLRLGPKTAVLGDQSNLFSDRLPEVAGAPIVVVAWQPTDAAHGTLQVAVRDAGRARWHVRVAAGETVRAADTDERGVARIEQLPGAGLQEVTLSCTELDD